MLLKKIVVFCSWCNDEYFIIYVEQIIKPLGRIAGTGMFKCIPPQDAFLIPEIDVR